MMVNMKVLALCTVVSCFAFTNTAIAQQSSLADSVQTCSKISANQARLSCFDKLVSKQESTRKMNNTDALTASQVDSFSKEQVKKTAEEKAHEIKSISLTISKLEKTARGKWKITFENGQKWQQKDTTKLKLKTGDKVIIEKGALSAVYLKKANANKRIKVKRLK